MSFSEFLVARNTINTAGAERAARLASESTERLGTVLLNLGLVSERDLAEAYAGYTGAALLKPNDLPVAPIAPNELSVRFLKKAAALPLSLDEKELKLAIVDPTDSDSIAAIRYAVGRPVVCLVALASDFAKAFQKIYETAEDSGGRFVTQFESSSVNTKDAERLRDFTSEAPIIQAVNHWVDRAVEIHASDIHLEATETAVQVRFRVDGQLQDVETLPAHAAGAISSRIKIMSRLDIAERRLPQDGKFRAPVRGRDIDFRVSIVPTVHGESIVLRVLDRGQVQLDFESLGYDETALARYRGILHRPHGIMLVTGPTGSGKTTTLYTSLMELRSAERKILTVEDPVEYQLEGINQTQVAPQIGLSFASALRSFLRHDPDIILVGEIRDSETARIAVQAALTGHLVLSTLHTNDAASAVTRLIDMGVDPYLITSTVNGVAAQRLVRRLCVHCRRPFRPDADFMARAGFRQPPEHLHQAVGCEHCRGTGYRGRSVITETLVMSDSLKSIVLKNADAIEIRKAAELEGMESMLHNGLRKCAAGETTLDEILRVTSVS